MKIEFSKKAIKDIDALQLKEKKKLKKYIEYIINARTLFDIPQTKRVKGTENIYRIKIQPYRIFIELRKNKLVIIGVNPRGSAYNSKK